MLPSPMTRSRPTFPRPTFSASSARLPSTSGHCLSACSFAPPRSVGCKPSAVSSPVSPFPATLASSLQIAEKPATLTPAFATLTSRVKHKSCVCHCYKKLPGWGMPFLSDLRTINHADPAPIFLATRHSPLVTSPVPLNLLESTPAQPPATVASKQLAPPLTPLNATLTKNIGVPAPLRH